MIKQARHGALTRPKTQQQEDNIQSNNKTIIYNPTTRGLYKIQQMRNKDRGPIQFEGQPKPLVVSNNHQRASTITNWCKATTTKTISIATGRSKYTIHNNQFDQIL